MAKLKLSDIDMGLGTAPATDPAHDAQTLLKQSLGTDSGDYRAIPLAQIAFNPNNDYAGADTEEDIRELANDIERNGLLHNIVVSDRVRENGTYMILSGERRYRAMSLLYREKQENQYGIITAKVLSGLDPLDEMLVLDAANLQTRGGMQDEKRFRKATMRFIENLRRKGGLSARDAVSLATKYTGVTKKLIDRNLSVEQDLHPALLKLLDDDLLPKNQAVQYAELPRETQALLAETLEGALSSGTAALRDANDKLFLATKTIASLHAQLETRESGLREVDEEIAGATLSLTALLSMTENETEDSGALENQIAEVRRTLATLETQRSMYRSTINSARAAIRKSEEKLAAIRDAVRDARDPGDGTVQNDSASLEHAPKRQEPNGNAQHSNALRDDIAAMVNKTVKKAESSMASLSSKTSISRLQRLDTRTKAEMRARLYDLRDALAETIAALEADGSAQQAEIAQPQPTAVPSDMEEADEPYIEEYLPEDGGIMQ